MARIADFQEMIQNSRPYGQVIKVGVQASQKWREHINNSNIVQDAFNTLQRNNNNEMIITRECVFNTISPIERVVKALIWGYPKGMQGTDNLRNIINHLNDIAQFLSSPELERPLSNQVFLNLYNDLTSISGMKQSTVSKLLYFFNIRMGNNLALIIDENVLSSFQAFDDFSEVSFNEDCGKRYIKQLKKMNSLARQYQFQPDQLEHFLFEFGKRWRNKNNCFVQQCILLMNSLVSP